VVRYAGVAFLLYTGGKNLVTAWRRRRSAATSPTVEHGSPYSSWWRALSQGFFTNVLNPKAPLLFLSIMPQFVPSGTRPSLALLGLSVIAVVIGLAWFLIVALAAERLGPLLRTPSRRNVVDGVSGVVMVAFAAAVAFH
jgi:threonine/homoserine/homoserine lactone efflux protein